MAMCLALLNRRGWRRAFPKTGPYTVIGEALLRIGNEIDPLQKSDLTVDAIPNEEQRKLVIEFPLRNSLFNVRESYVSQLGRLAEMFCDIAPAMTSDPEYLDLRGTFRRATGIRLETYLSMGMALLSTYIRIDDTTIGDAPIIIRTSEFLRNTGLRRTARKLFHHVSVDKRAFRKNLQADRQRHGHVHYKFLEAERHPLVRIKQDRLCCLSLRLLQRKFSSGIHHLIIGALHEQDIDRYFRFFGRVFERYVQQVCLRMFGPDRFVPGFKYGKARKEASDGWILYGDGAIILDAKAARFTLDIRLSGSFGSFERKLRDSVLRAAGQFSHVIDDFRSGAFTVGGLNSSQLRTFYPLIVTLEEIPINPFVVDYIGRILAAEHLPGI
jgi:hypothetical protein